MRRHILTIVSVLIAGAVVLGAGPTTRPAADLDPGVRKVILASIDKGLAYLDKTQKPDGTWSNSVFPAITALAARAYLDHPEGRYTRTSPQVSKALAAIIAQAKDGGREGIHQKVLENYNTSICLSTLVRAGDPAYAPVIANARQYLAEKMIWSEKSQGVTKDDLRYGGAGYGQGRATPPASGATPVPSAEPVSRPDLSNTQWMVEALAESGLAATDPAFERVVTFVKRCQNFRDKDSHPEAGTDGGMYYAAYPPESKAGRDPAGGLKSYGGMTYAGFKSFLHAGMTKDDPRVRAAWDWIRANYTVETNPGLGKAGLFYYYHTMAKALHLTGERAVVDPKGVAHDWRADLGQHLARIQAADGSWVNEADRWEEGDPVLVTAYAVLAMEYCLAPQK